jgi:hypothetical protein
MDAWEKVRSRRRTSPATRSRHHRRSRLLGPTSSPLRVIRAARRRAAALTFVVPSAELLDREERCLDPNQGNICRVLLFFFVTPFLLCRYPRAIIYTANEPSSPFGAERRDSMMPLDG